MTIRPCCVVIVCFSYAHRIHMHARTKHSDANKVTSPSTWLFNSPIGRAEPACFSGFRSNKASAHRPFEPRQSNYQGEQSRQPAQRYTPKL
ncbi:uncharacterized protein SETTUDRAFT_163553 [Exserohilum turcica Et28A]|uniref:Uncharacterized protein n=1 Tax=Exserohilum turcicum (strain 28A) TaxID=671987 RepID=R0K8X4_EXST2|nr:uncharacterized protein SETTUDRAFT_163553 [Exserohilum turcica Et28A]EOA84707.1 hypothetical protein SETTUDRAFT_163553 [Exserohilum turcica Et28A]